MSKQEDKLSYIQSAIDTVKNGDDDKAWEMFSWIFYSSPIDDDGFEEAALNCGENPEALKKNLLDESQRARDFYYGKSYEDEKTVNDASFKKLEVVK